MGNRDISEALDVSYQTVLKYIGPQPSRGGVVARKVPVEIPEPAPEDREPAVLALSNVVRYFVGAAAEYSIDVKGREVRLMAHGDGGMATVPFDKWADFAREVAAIGRHLAQERVPPEAW